MDGQRYDAFISYSHAADGQLAPALRAALQRFAKPWYRRRALHIFLDQTSLAATPELWPTIQTALDEARYFLLLASPEAAQSPWVRREVGHWLATKPPGRLFIVLTGGELVRNDASTDFDWPQTTALPQELQGVFPAGPLWVDLRWAHEAEQLSLKHPQFLAAVGDLAAPLRGQPKDDLLGEEVRQHRRTVRLAVGAIMALVALLVVALAGAGVALEQRSRAEEGRQVAVAAQGRAEEASQLALARQLAAQASTERTGSLDTRLLLAVEAHRLNPGAADVRSSLLNLLATNPNLGAFLPGDHQPIDAIAYDPNGTRLVTSGPSGLFVWNPATHTQIAGPLGGPPDSSMPIVFSPDGGVLATSWQQGIVSILDGDTFAPIEELRFEQPARFFALSFSPDGAILAAAGTWNDTTGRDTSDIVLWNWAEQNQVSVIRASVSDLGFGPDNTTLLSASSSGSVSVWDWKSGKLLRSFSPAIGNPPIMALAVSPDASAIAIGTAEGTVHLWSLEESESRDELVRPDAIEFVFDPAIREVAFSPDGRTLAAGSENGLVYRWNLSSLEPEGEPLGGHAAPVTGVSFSPDSEHLISGALNGTVAVWDLEPIARIGRQFNDAKVDIMSFALTSDGETLAAGDSTGSVHFWDVRTGKTAAGDIVAGVGGVTSLSFSPNDQLLATGDAMGQVAVWDTESFAAVQKQWLGHGGEWVMAVVFMRDGRVLVSGGLDGTVRWWDVAWGESLNEGPVFAVGKYVLSLALAPDGSLLAAATHGGIQFLDMANHNLSGDLVPGLIAGGDVNLVAFSPDGQTLAAGGLGGAELIDVTTRRRTGALYLPQGGSTSAVAFSPDSKTLATGGSDGSVRLWDVSTDQVVGQFPAAHRGFMNWLNFTPDGRFLVSNDAAGDLMVWDTSVDSWLTQACMMANRNLTREEWTQFLGDEPYHDSCSDLLGPGTQSQQSPVLGPATPVAPLFAGSA